MHNQHHNRNEKNGYEWAYKCFDDQFIQFPKHRSLLIYLKMEEAKISLSPSEFELVTNAEIILTKNRVIQKFQNELGHLANLELDYARNHSFSQLSEFNTSPKISKGENYMGLPYIILDFPRYSNGNDFFFIRQMFWWGHFFSSTLQVKGKYLELLKEGIQHLHIDNLSDDYFIGIHQDPWKHHFESDNYISIRKMCEQELKQLFNNREYIKIATNWPLSNYNRINELFFESWKILLKISGLIA